MVGATVGGASVGAETAGAVVATADGVATGGGSGSGGSTGSMGGLSIIGVGAGTLIVSGSYCSSAVSVGGGDDAHAARPSAMMAAIHPRSRVIQALRA